MSDRTPLVRANYGLDTRHWGDESSDEDGVAGMPGYTPLPTGPTEAAQERVRSDRPRPVSLRAEFNAAADSEDEEDGEPSLGILNAGLMGRTSVQEDGGDEQEASRTTRGTRMRSEVRIPPARTMKGEEVVASSQGKSSTNPSPDSFSSEPKKKEDERQPRAARSGSGKEREDAVPMRERMFPSVTANYDRYLKEELEARPRPKIRPGDEVVLVSRASRRTQVEDSVWQSKWDVLTGARPEVIVISKWDYVRLPGLRKRLENPKIPSQKVRVGSKVEVRCGEAFTGDPSSGSSLQTYWMDIKANLAMWEEEGWSLRTMFHRMHATLRGDAARFYQEVMEGVLDMPQTDQSGEDVMDGDGYLMPIQDPVSLFMALLERAYPTNTRERADEYASFARGPTETALACEQRLRSLAADLGYVDSADLARKYLNAQPRWIQDEAKKEAARSGIHLRLRVARDAVTFVEVNLRMAGWEPDISREERQPKEGRRRAGGMVNVMEGSEGVGQRPTTGYNRACWNCGQEGHLARDCPKEDRRGQNQGSGAARERDEWRGQGGTKEERPVGRSNRDHWRTEGEQRAGNPANGAGWEGRRQEVISERRDADRKGIVNSGASAAANDREALEREIRRLRSQLADERKSREAARVNLLQGEPREERGGGAYFGHTREESQEDSEDETARTSSAYYGETVEGDWEEWEERPSVYVIEAMDPPKAHRGELREKGELGLRGWREEDTVMPQPAKTQPSRKVYASCTVEVDLDPPARGVQERQEQEATVVRLNNREGVVKLEGLVPRRIIVDTGANRMVMGRRLAEALGEKARQMNDEGTVMGLASGSARVQLTEESLELCLMQGSEHETSIKFRFLVTETDGYDLLLGTPLWYKVGGDISFWKERVWFRSDYLKRTGYRHIVSLPATFVSQRVSLEQVQQGEIEDEVYYQGNNAAELLRERGMMDELAEWEPEEGGVVLLDLFSGVGTAMAAVVRAGLKLKRWYAVEKDQAAAQAAECLRACIERECKRAIPRRQAGGIPQDIRHVSEAVLRQMEPVDLIVAGWECQGHSRAGAGRGLGDDRSGLFWEMIRVLRAAKAQWPGVAIILENVDSRDDPREPVRRDYQLIERILGEGLELDAARFGSRAHRNRVYWTNLTERGTLEEEASKVERDPELVVSDILEPRRRVQLVERDDRQQQYVCNFKGMQRRAWPTLMASEASYAFRKKGERPGPGMVWDESLGDWTEPTANERERAMGFPAGGTAAPGLTERQRCRLLGNAMDLNVLAWLVRVGVEYASYRGVKYTLAAMATMVEAEVTPQEEFEWQIGPEWPEERRGELMEMLATHRQCFAFEIQGLGRYTGPIRFSIKLDTMEPIRQPKRRWSPDHEEIAKEKCQELMEAGLIVRSESPHAAATVMAKKVDLLGEKGALRMCGDYRWLNRHTERDSYPMPCPEEIFDKLGGSKWFSTLDLRQGFNQIPLSPEDQPKTAFHGPDGQYHWTVMPFGLRNASACFQRVMDCSLEGLDFTACFIDDVIVYSESCEAHLKHVAEVLERISTVRLTCHPKKCKFGLRSIPYLGLQVGNGELTVQQAKVAVLDKLPPPTDLGRLRTFLGFTGYYRRFVKDYAGICKPLTLLTRKDEPWRWEEVQERAFRSLCNALQTAPVLSLPRFDQPFTLYTDWSSVGMGAILSQEANGIEKVIAFASRSCNSAESNYSSYEGEGAAVVWGVMHFRAYLQGRKFTLVTDHQPLEWLMNNQTLRGKNARWAMILQEFDFTIRHRAGKQQQHVDGLSRNPVTEGERETVWGPEELEWQPVRALAMMGDMVDRAARLQYKEAKGGGAGDVWLDKEVLLWLKGGDIEEEESREGVSARARGRALSYRWDGQHLWIRRQEGERQVPAPAGREALYWKVHDRLGHYGGARTLQLLRTTYWWNNMQGDVRKWQAGCQLCAQVRARAVQAETELQSLPIRELGHRWSLDLLGELPMSRRGKRYVLVMIEHVSKWVELVALSSKSAGGIASAFLREVLSRFGACAEVLTDQGGEFKGELQRLLDACGIRHRGTSAYHPEANGLTERAVQTFKRGLRKYALMHDKRDWDLELPWLLMGYRFSRQESTKLSPYYMLYGREPILPVGSVKELVEPLPEMSSADWVRVAKLRAQLFRSIMPTALGNLQAAQERDSRRHQMRRNRLTGEQERNTPQLEVGQWVYVKRPTTDTLDTGVTAERWRVLGVRSTGVIQLQNEKGEERLVHRTQCMKAGQQGAPEDMAAEGAHGDRQPFAGGKNHVHRSGTSHQSDTEELRPLRNQEITSVYQRRQRRGQPAAEDATAVTIESFYKVIQ